MCRVLGVIGQSGDVSPLLVLGLCMQIYAGEDSTGLATFHQGQIVIKKSRGKAIDVFPEIDPELTGGLAIGHNGCAFSQIQPILVRVNNQSVAIATDSSSRTTLNIVRILRNSDGIINGLKEAMQRIRKPFALIALSPRDGLIAARNSGIKPLTIGRFDIDGLTGFYAASQSGVLLKGSFIDVVDPGNITILNEDSISDIAVLPRPERRYCPNEELFRQLPGNRSGKRDVRDIRLDIGRSLGKKFQDIFSGSRRRYKAIPILEGGRLFAMGFSETVGPNVMTDPAGSIRNIYSVPPEMKRIAVQVGLSENFALTPIPNIRGERIILIDDQLRSGGKIKHMTDGCLKLGAKEIIAVVGSIGCAPCPFGDSAYIGEELIAQNLDKTSICQELGISDLISLEVDELIEAMNTPDRIYCVRCLEPSSLAK